MPPPPPWPPAAAAAAALGLGAGPPLVAAAGACPWEPLQALQRGPQPLYTRVAIGTGDGSSAARSSSAPATNSTISCAAFTNGACNYSVPFPDFDCLVNCVASEQDCVRLNPRTVGVNPALAPHACTSCSIAACASCHYPPDGGEVRCQRCVEGFAGTGGSEGSWERCVLKSQDYLHAVFTAVYGLLGALTLAIVVTVVMGTVREFRPVFRRLTHFHLFGHDASHRLAESPSGPRPPASLPERNLQAIRQGLFYSLTSSIKFSSLRHTEHKSSEDQHSLARHVRHALDTEAREIGLGLQLLFRSQLFFLGVAVTMWLFSMANSDHHRTFHEFTDLAGRCMGSSGELEKRQRLLVEAQGRYAEVLQGRCLVLWAVLLLGSWGFHWRQRHFFVRYDKATLSSQDYTLKLKGLPSTMTSEKWLKHILERELRMQGKIHGVSICYDIKGLKASGVDPSRIDAMIEHIVEVDDLANKWCSETLSRPKAEMEERLRRDREELRGLLLDGRLKGSGIAYVVFKKQRYMVQVSKLHRGIELRAFVPEHEKEDMKPGRACYKPRFHTASLKAMQAIMDSHLEDMVSLRGAFCEPAGLRWKEFKQRRKDFGKRLALMTLRMLIYLGLYGVVVRLFYVMMVNPWQDHFVDSPESAVASLLTGRLVLLLNFAMQSIVVFEVEHVGLMRTGPIDQMTMLWATVLFLITNGYIVVQECSREGIRWSLLPPANAKKYSEEWWHWQRSSFQATLIERSVGENLVGVMMDQVTCLYVLGEVANVLLPVTRKWVALRLTFGPYLSERARAWAARLLRPLLPRSESPSAVTAREAEKAQLLMPLLLWMEYTYMVVFTGMALVTFFFITDESCTICGYLILFGLIFYAWQRYVLLWLYAPATHDSPHSYRIFIWVWGTVLSIAPTASVWWAWRRGVIQEEAFTYVMMAIVYVLAVLIYLYGIMLINWLTVDRMTGVDDFHDSRDPGYVGVMEEHGSSWWNMNPIYVLKNRHCPDLEGHEVHSDVQCWPENQERQGFFEPGKEFRHEPRSRWMRRHGKSSVRHLMERFSSQDKTRVGAMFFRTIFETFSETKG